MDTFPTFPRFGHIVGMDPGLSETGAMFVEKSAFDEPFFFEQLLSKILVAKSETISGVFESGFLC